MDAVFVHAPLPRPSPLDFQHALKMWDCDQANDSGTIELDTQEQSTASGAESETLQGTPHDEPTSASRMQEYTRSKLIVQTQILRSKLNYFRMLLASATLNEEQYVALQQFAMELQTAMDVIMARCAPYNEAAAYAQSFSPSSASEDDITNIPPESLASPASTSSWEGSLSASSEYGVEPAAYPIETTSLGFVPSSFVAPTLPANWQASQEPMYHATVMPTFDQNVFPSPNEIPSMQVEPSNTYVPLEARLPSVIDETAIRAGSYGHPPTNAVLHDLWPDENVQWASQPLGPPSEGGTLQSFASPAPQMPPWNSSVPPSSSRNTCTIPSLASMRLLPTSLYPSEMGAHVPAYDNGTTGTISSDAQLANAQMTEWHEPQRPRMQMPEAVTQLQAVPYNAGLPPRDSGSMSWSSNMSECSIVG